MKKNLILGIALIGAGLWLTKKAPEKNKYVPVLSKVIK
tara:strand:- start:591 stop:704 length:114 start_codon:yes stop_codon:yes gene_type:complete